MPATAADVAAVLVLVLPGFLAYRFALFRRADPAERSPLWQLAEILEYSVYVHLLGAGLVLSIHGLLQLFAVESYLNELPGKSPLEFLNKHFLSGVLLFTLYPLYVILAAILMGVYDLPKTVGNLVLRSTAASARFVRGWPLIGWVRPPSPEYPREPIWYLALNEIPRQVRSSRTLLLVKMKQGDIYYGELASYPIQPDERKEKDFLIRKARYYPMGDFTKEHRLDDTDGIGAVLLNTADIESIQIYYDRSTG